MRVRHIDGLGEWLESGWQKHLQWGKERSGIALMKSTGEYNGQATIKSEEGEFTASCQIV